MSKSEYVSEIDPARSIHLPDSEWYACVAIGPDGAESLWLASPTPDQPPGCACPACAPHDQDTHPDRQREEAT
jgi:hypothetical protein